MGATLAVPSSFHWADDNTHEFMEAFGESYSCTSSDPQSVQIKQDKVLCFQKLPSATCLVEL